MGDTNWLQDVSDVLITSWVALLSTALTIILPILFLYVNTVIVTAGTFEP
jgi:hypothetical protein